MLQLLIRRVMVVEQVQAIIDSSGKVVSTVIRDPETDIASSIESDETIPFPDPLPDLPDGTFIPDTTPAGT